MTAIWRCHQDQQDPWLTAVVQSLHPGDDLHDLQLSRKLDPLQARQASNVARVQQLLDYGGLWLDNDLIPLRRLTDAPAAWVASCRGHLEGCAMFFPAPGHRFLQVLLTLLERTPDQLLQRHLQRAERIQPIGRVPQVCPFDAWGKPTGVEPWAVHTWATSSARARKVAWTHG